MSEQPRDPLQAYRVLGGPMQGERFACPVDSFDVLTGEPWDGVYVRVTYCLRPEGDSHVWCCAIEPPAAPVPEKLCT